MSIKTAETDLFKKWAKSINQDISEFCPNGGLLFRGDFYLNPPDENGLCTWNRREGNEEILWNSSPRRIMVLTKDLNDDELWDIRVESGGRAKANSYSNNISEVDVRYLGIPFYRKLNRWVFGIFHARVDSTIDFEQVKDKERMARFYEQVPLVRINCKQEVGTSSVLNTILDNAINKAKDLLAEQIKIYNANVILCCGYSENVRNTGNIILNFLTENIYNDLILIPNTEGWCYYSPNHNIIAINSYHPTTTEDTDEVLYMNLVSNFTKALQYVNSTY